MKRPIKSSQALLGVYAYCTNCDWKAGARNGVGLGAQHYYRTGHRVIAEVTRAVFFESPDVNTCEVKP